MFASLNPELFFCLTDLCRKDSYLPSTLLMRLSLPSGNSIEGLTGAHRSHATCLIL